MAAPFDRGAVPPHALCGGTAEARMVLGPGNVGLPAQVDPIGRGPLGKVQALTGPVPNGGFRFPGTEDGRKQAVLGRGLEVGRAATGPTDYVWQPMRNVMLQHPDQIGGLEPGQFTVEGVQNVRPAGLVTGTNISLVFDIRIPFGGQVRDGEVQPFDEEGQVLRSGRGRVLAVHPRSECADRVRGRAKIPTRDGHHFGLSSQRADDSDRCLFFLPSVVVLALVCDPDISVGLDNRVCFQRFTDVLPIHTSGDLDPSRHQSGLILGT
ncbi:MULTISPECIES: hypothetical protein [unclassified Streptomyces]|uniref:hypothetical protein n=1 Tax=unclassified Streptomyces TaxID=2593676 RepID=UPI00336A2BAA